MAESLRWVPQSGLIAYAVVHSVGCQSLRGKATAWTDRAYAERPQRGLTAYAVGHSVGE